VDPAHVIDNFGLRKKKERFASRLDRHATTIAATQPALRASTAARTLFDSTG